MLSPSDSDSEEEGKKGAVVTRADPSFVITTTKGKCCMDGMCTDGWLDS